MMVVMMMIALGSEHREGTDMIGKIGKNGTTARKHLGTTGGSK